MKRFLLACLLLSPLFAQATPAPSEPPATLAESFACTVSISGDLTFCAGGNTTLRAVVGRTGLTIGAAITYAWRRGPVGGSPGGAVIGTDSTLSVSQAGTYNVTITGTSCSATSATVTVTQTTLAAGAITFSGQPEFCAGTGKQLTANPTGGATPYAYQWILGTTALGGASNATYNATQGGSYTYVVTDARSCTATSAAQVLTQNPSPTVNATASSDVICAGSGGVTLTATPGSGTPPYSYQWRRGASNAPGASTSSTYNATTAGNYTVVVTDSKGCSVTSSVLAITTSNLDVLAIGGPGEFCAGSSVQLSANFTGGEAPYSYAWRKDGAPVGTNASTFSANAPGNYRVRVTDSKGCSDSSAVKTLIQNPVPSANAGPGGTFTGTQTYSLTGVTTGSGGTGALSYAWSTNPGGVTISPNANAATPTIGPFTQSVTVQLTVTDAKSCSATSSAAVTFAPCTVTATVAAAPSDVLCTTGQTITLTVTAGGGTPGYTYQWRKDGQIVGSNAATLPLTAAGSYTVTVTDTKGCAITPPATVITQSNLAANLPNGPSEFCANGNINLTANQSGGVGPFSYQWKNGTNDVGGNSATLNVTTAGSYSVVITDSKGCTQTSPARTVSVNPVPTANAGPGRTLVCDETYNLNGVTVASGGAGGYTYQWSTSPGNVPINTSSSSNPVVGPFPDVRNYNVTVLVTDSKGCQASQTAVVTKGNNPLSANISAPATSICPNGSIALTASFGGNSGDPSFQWQNDAGNIGGQTGLVYVAFDEGNYRVVVSDNRGCRTTSNSIRLGRSTLAATISSPSNFRYCDNGRANFAQLTVNATGGAGSYQYRWYGGAAEGQTTTRVDVFAGFFGVDVTDAQGCKIRAGDVEVKALPRPVANAGPGTVLTGDEKYDLTKVANFTPATGGTPAYFYRWTSAPDTVVKSTADKPVLGEFTRTNIVTLVVTDVNGCVSDPDTATVRYLPCQLTNRIVGNNYVCNNNTTTLTANAANGWGDVRNYRYQWRLGTQLINSDSVRVAITRGGLYALTAIDTRGCRRTDTLRVQELPQLLVTVDGPANYCRGSNASLLARVQNGAPRFVFEWRNGNIPLAGDSARYFLQGGGTYTVRVTDSRGCTGVLAQPITVVEKGQTLSAVVIPPNGPTTVYAPATVTLNAQTGTDYTYQWLKDSKEIAGATTPTYVVTPEKDPGKANYAIKVGNSEGCFATSTALTVEVIIPTAVGPVRIGEFAMSAFPSPTSGRIQVNVSLEKPAPATFHLTDLNGRTLTTRVSPFADSRHTAEFDLSTQPNGLYLLRVEADGQHTVQKVVKAN